jgi:hypothetical protein
MISLLRWPYATPIPSVRPVEARPPCGLLRAAHPNQHFDGHVQASLGFEFRQSRAHLVADGHALCFRQRVVCLRQTACARFYRAPIFLEREEKRLAGLTRHADLVEAARLDQSLQIAGI